ncbi:MAG: discoidin domain-containing protein [Deltaproteobacteria bacterium]|nr:discoidin domain-containing protein [Deltaproteobacteria bacterium]
MLQIVRLFWVGAAVLSAVLMTASFSYGVERERLTIHIDASTPVASFMPDEAFGAGLDGLEEDELKSTYSPENIKTMAGAPYRRLSCRLRTELGIEAWHWNEAGSWSDESKKEGYWTSSDKAKGPLLKSFGYKLPRRGSTIDQAGDDGYSRLDDGDKSTFWKSNPYLDGHFTGEDNALHPQWVLIDLGKRCNVNALRILWGEPYATKYEVQYWDGKDTDYVNHLTAGVWRLFAHGQVQDGKGGNTLLRFGDAPVSVRFVRILLSASSGTAPQNEDVRDRLGYAIRELFLDGIDGRGKLKDIIRHGASNKSQTLMVVSSTDPWHRAVDRNPNSAHPGFDQVMASGLGRGNHVLVPTPLLYDIPENAAAEIRFLKSRGFPMSQIELGEEPDGQNVSPEHYGALYLQFAKVIHEIDPALITGGPSFQSEVGGWETIIDEKGEHSWMKRFLDYLRERKRLDDFGFFSFEWYPFDDVCQPPAGQLITQPLLMKNAFERLDREGVPCNIPWIISEYGYSSFAGRAEVELPAALLNAEIVAQFLTLGGKTAYYYGLEPKKPIRELDCAHTDRLWGNLMMFQKGPNGKAKWLLPAYYGGKMLMEEWAEPINKQHQLFRALVKEDDKVVNDVTAYVVRRPDGHWAVMVFNKSTECIELGKIRFDSMGSNGIDWSEPLDVIQYSPLQYTWRAEGANGHPKRSEPPVHFQVLDELASGITLPPMSFTVVRGAHP